MSGHLAHGLSWRARSETGVIAVIVTLSATALLGATALAVDLGRLYQRRHLLQNAVDFGATPLRLGRELAIDPATERATDPEANALFTREYRKGYELPRT